MRPITSLTTSRLRRPRHAIVGSATAVLVAGLVAAGCGGDDGSTKGDPGASTSVDVTAQDGPLSWLPRETWFVSQADVSNENIDTALETLGRLPIWPLAESALPAKDAKGLREEAFQQIAKEADGDDAPSAKELEDAFGERGGIAITDNDFSRFENDDEVASASPELDRDGENRDNPDDERDPSGGGSSTDDIPVLAWVEVDDADKAEGILAKAIKDDETVEHAGVEFHVGTESGDEVAWIVSGDLLVFVPGRKEFERVLDARDDGRTIADDEDARRVLEATLDGSMGGVAIGTDRLIDAIPAALAEDEDVPKDVRDQVGDILATNAIDSLVPDWVGASATIDDVGVRAKFTWSNPRPIAEADQSARELAERMPASGQQVSASTMDASWVGRVQRAWSVVRDETDVELADVAKDCPSTEKWACDVAVEGLRIVLEDGDFADAMEATGGATFAATQDIGAVLEQTLDSVNSAAAATVKPAALRTAAAAPATRPNSVPTGRTQEFAYVPGEEFEYDAPKEWTDALDAAGLTIELGDGGTSTRIAVAPASPLGTQLKAVLADPAVKLQFGTLGIDPADLLTPAGITIEPEQVDDVLVYGFPLDAESPLADALRSGDDTLGDLPRYTDVVDAAKVPGGRIGVYSWLDIYGLAEVGIGIAEEMSPEADRFTNIARQNVSHVPGLLTWSTRSEVDGEDVGVAEVVIPILEDAADVE